MVGLLRSQGYSVTSAGDYQAAVEALNQHAPEFLISDLRLGAFNALHLAIRQRHNHPGAQTIVLDVEHSADIEREAKNQGALYLVEPIDAAELLARISAKLAEDGPPRRWPRKVPARLLSGTIAQQGVRIADLSYGGIRVEVEEGVELPSPFDISVPKAALEIRARTVWTRAASRGWTFCGAEITDADPGRQASWRRLVDSVEEA